MQFIHPAIRFCSIVFSAALLSCASTRSGTASAATHVAAEDSFNSNGISIHYISKGKGTPVILLHGFFADSKWNWIQPGVFDSLAKNFYVIAMDVRGHGASGKPHSPGAYGREMLEDINRLMAHLRIDKAHLVGYSMGGEIVLSYLTSYPGKVIRAVAGGCGWVKTGDEKSKLWEQYRDLFANMPPGTRITDTMWPGGDTTSDFAKLINANDPVALSGLAGEMTKLAIEESRLQQNQVETLLVVGENDPLKTTAESAVKSGKHIHLQILAQQDHISAISDPSFTKAMIEFLQSN